MATKLFILLSSGDKEVALEVGLVYPLSVAKNKWMDEVKVILYGPSEKLAAYDVEVQEKLKELQENGIEVMICKYCADKMNITGILEENGFKVIYVSPIIAQMLKDGWASLTF
jgi:hypothetical protein